LKPALDLLLLTPESAYEEQRMKMNIVIDCTPEEARHFLGLPDVKPMQEAALSRMQQRMLETVDAISPEALMRTWFGFMGLNSEQVRESFANFMKNPFGGPAEKNERRG
jgi:hypothetical protein